MSASASQRRLLVELAADAVVVMTVPTFCEGQPAVAVETQGRETPCPAAVLALSSSPPHTRDSCGRRDPYRALSACVPRWWCVFRDPYCRRAGASWRSAPATTLSWPTSTAAGSHTTTSCRTGPR